MDVARVAVALLLVVAGCGGEVAEPATAPTTNGTVTEPTPSHSPSPTAPTTESTVAPGELEMFVTNGELPLAPEPVFTDVLNLTQTTVDTPIVEIETRDGTDPTILDKRQSPFRRSLGITTPENASVRKIAYTPADGTSVHIYKPLLSDRQVTETTLAHEFVHVVQFGTGWGGEMWEDRSKVGYKYSYDGWVTYYLILEGAATFVQDRYEQRYTNHSRTAMERKRAAYANASALRRLSIARYYYGSQYVAERAGSPTNLSDVHLNAPNSSEQVLHGSDDPIADLELSVDEGDGWNVEDRDRMGELFLRIALRTELNCSTAVDAAAGWGEDRRITYTNGETRAYAWALRWDDAANATEFEAAFNTYLDAKATQEGSIWTTDEGNSSYRVERVRENTVVLFLGDKSFVQNASVGEEGEEIVIEP